MKNTTTEPIYNNFTATLQHDNGKTKVKVRAISKQEVIKRLCTVENCPPSAVTKIQIEKPSIYDIKRRTEETNPYFFSRDTMKFFKQTFSSFKVYRQENDTFLISAPSLGGNYTERIFNPYTNQLTNV